MTRDEVKILLETLSVAYPTQASKIDNKKLMVDLWEGYLKAYPGEVVFTAVKAYIGNKKNRFFPSIGEFKNTVDNFNGMSLSTRQIEAPKEPLTFDKSGCQLCFRLEENQTDYCKYCIF